MQVWSAPPSKTPEQDFWEREKQKEFFLFLFFSLPIHYVWKSNLTAVFGGAKWERDGTLYHIWSLTSVLPDWHSSTLPRGSDLEWLCVWCRPYPCLGPWVGDVRVSSCVTIGFAPSMGSAGTSNWSLADSRVRVKDHTVVRGSAFSQALLCGAIVNFNQILGS